jgi:hypothetical protein
VRVIGVPSEIRSGHILNSSHRRSRLGRLPLCICGLCINLAAPYGLLSVTADDRYNGICRENGDMDEWAPVLPAGGARYAVCAIVVFMWVNGRTVSSLFPQTTLFVFL